MLENKDFFYIFLMDYPYDYYKRVLIFNALI